MKTLFVLALIALFVQGLLAGPIGGGALKRSAREVVPEKDAPVENPPLKKVVTDAPVSVEKMPSEARQEPKDEEISPGAFQGDMMLTFEQVQEVITAIDDQQNGRKKRKATSNLNTRWPLNIVPYVIEDSSLGDAGVIRAAMDHWEEHTCLRFEPQTSSHSTQLEHSSYLSFFKDQGCWSYVGRVSDGRQRVSIGEGCGYLGIVAHEIGHAIGFHHEQSRPDRDDYITVHLENVFDGYERQFSKYTWSQIEAHDVDYDIGSVMHYGSHGFSKNGQPTITTLNPLDQNRLGNRAGLSMADIQLANLFYECDAEECPGDLQCENGSNLDPNCVCVCPFGFSGDRCEIVDETAECVFRLTDREGEITSPNYPRNYDNNHNCLFLIEGSPGTTIELTFLDMDIESHASCGYDAVEVRTDDVSAPGQKFCGSDLPPVQTSTGNQMLVAFTSDYSVVGRGFKASYVIVGDEEEEVVGTCGGNFDGSGGAMASPNYPENYDNNLNCVYNIQVETGRRVELSLLDFSLEDQSSCGWDALEVDLGDGIKVPMKLCGSESPAGSLVSLGNQMVLTLKTDRSVTSGGFKASYRAIDL